jgi:Phytanoyl-CoA dioxygenase (PhyH)
MTEEFRRDGAIVLRDVLSAEHLDLLAAGIERVRAEPSDLAIGEDFPTRLFHDHVLVKEPGTTARTPWHQDQPYYCIDGAQNVSFWIPLDPVPRESTLEFVAGSHAPGTWFMPRSFVQGTAMVFDEGALEEVPDVEADRGAHEILGWLIGDDVTFAPRPHRTSPPFEGLELEAGAPLDHPLFPVLWTC